MNLWQRCCLATAILIALQFAFSTIAATVLFSMPQRAAWAVVILVAGLIAGAAAAFLAARWLCTYLSGNLNTLSDSAARLAKGQPPLKPIMGGDEFAKLDQKLRQIQPATAQQAAPSQRMGMRSFSRKAADVICGLDVQLRFISVNPACKSVWEYEPADLQGKSIAAFVDEPDLEKAREALERCRSTQAPTTFESGFRCGSGRLADMLWSASWSESDQAVCCVVHDITEAKAIERMKREFVQMISHDLRTPLTGVRNVLTMVREGVYGALDADGQKAVFGAQTNTERLIRLINELLDLEKLEAGKMELTLAPAHVSFLVEYSLESVEGFARHYGVRLLYEGDDAELNVDGDRVVQVLINLLSNAIKFSPRGSRVEVRSRVERDALVVEVVDRGPGIPAAEAANIFDRFKQVRSTHGRIQTGGSGLGLAISKAIVQEHGGTIGVTSTEGQGSTFWVRLPLEPSPAHGTARC